MHALCPGFSKQKNAAGYRDGDGQNSGKCSFRNVVQEYGRYKVGTEVDDDVEDDAGDDTPGLIGQHAQQISDDCRIDELDQVQMIDTEKHGLEENRPANRQCFFCVVKCDPAEEEFFSDGGQEADSSEGQPVHAVSGQ